MSWIARFVSLVFLVLACFALPQQAAAQNSVTIGFTTYTISDAVATEGGTARFEITGRNINTNSLTIFDLNTDVTYTAGSADLEDLGSDRPTTYSSGGLGLNSHTIEVPIAEDDTVEENETFTVQVNIVGNSPTFAVQATGRIIDNDGTPPPAVNISIAPASATEGGDIRFPVTLSTALLEARTLDIGYTAGSGNTGAGLDDLGSDRPTTLTLPTGTTTVNLVVPTVDDTDDENNETFTVTLSLPDPPADPANTLAITTSTATGTINDNDETPPPTSSVTVSITADKTAAVENAADGGTATFKVNLTRPLVVDVVLAVAYAGGASNPATPADDLGSDRPTTVTIDRGTTEATLTVPISKDLIVEGDETFTVTLSEDKDNPLPDGVTIGNGVATRTIEDDDTALVTLSPADSTAAEDGAFTYTVNLSAEVDEAVVVRWTATDGTATVANDLQATTSTVTFAANDSTAQTFTISPANDNEDEDNETFTVTLGPDTDGNNPLPDGVTIGADDSSAATIIDDDDTPKVTATVSIDDESVAENVSGGTVTFTAELTAAVGSPVVLAAEVTAGTATLGVDLGTDLPTTVTIDRGRTSGTFTVPITDDNTVEGDETFTVTLRESPITGLPDGVTIRDGTATGTITENDTAEVTLTADTATANENGGTFSYTVNLSAAADEAVTVRWTATDGTAIVANDLQATTNTVTFAANDSTAQTFTISPANDDEDEDNETFTVTLGPDGDNPLPTGVTIRTNDSSEATITDDDDTPVVTAMVSIDDESVVENVASGTVTFTAALTAAVSSPVVLAVAVTAGTATVADDLRRPLPTSVTIDANTTMGTFTVPINDDSIVEGNETFTVTLSESDTADLPDGVTIRDGTATGTITENDTAEVTLTANTATANENGGTFSYTVSLSAAADEAVVVRWTATDGTAIVATDLQATTATVTFAANDSTAQTFTISPVNDNEDEDNETFTVTLGPDTDGNNPLPTGVTIRTNNSSEATITDDDDTPVATATVSIDDESVAENVAGGTVTFTAELTTAVSSPVVLAVEVAAGTATLGVDLGRPLLATVTIDANATEATFTVPITDDDIVEGNETFTVTLSESATTSLPEGVTILDGIATGTIAENDTAEVTLTPARATAAEGGTFSYTVSLSAAADEAVTVRWTATAEAGDTATVADDLRAATGTVTFAANTRANQAFAIRPAADTTDEDDETFTVTLGPDTQGGNPLPAGVTIGAGSSSAATITDSDGTAPTVTVSIAPVTVDESVGNAVFTATLSGAVDRAVTLDVAVAAGSTNPVTLAEDLGALPPATVTIDRGRTTAAITVPIIDDMDAEEDETFTVTLSESAAAPLPAGVVIPGGRATATGTIEDDDEAPAAALEPSVLTGPRLIAAGTALRRHAGRFDSLTGRVARNRLDARGTRRLSASENAGDGAAAAGGGLGGTRWGAWVDGAWAGFDGKASGRQADVYGGVDLGGAGRRWLIGVLVGYEVADLDIGEATYRSDYVQIGVYGGARVSERLLFDGAVTYGTATPDITLEGVSASYDARRITARGALTGDFGLEYGRVLVQPQLGLLYARERLDAFGDSAGGGAEREDLKLGRFTAGPRLTWAFDGGEVAGGVRAQWDFLQIDDGGGSRVSGAADIGIDLDLTPNVTLGLQGDIDGIGVSDDFGSLGGSVELDVRF